MAQDWGTKSVWYKVFDFAKNKKSIDMFIIFTG